jgi:MFS family permease
VGFLLSALLAWRAGNLPAFFIACALTVCMILLWLGVGNVLSVWLPVRDEPLRSRRQSGSLKQFAVAFTVSYAIGYLVNLMLIWRVFAARELAARLGNVIVPVLFVVLSSAAMWLLLTVFAVALSQQPKVRRTLLREIADYSSNAEARALAEESAREMSGAGARSA